MVTCTSTGRSSTKDYYEKHADEYFLATHALDLGPLWDKLVNKLEAGARVVDIGCGSGRDLRHFSQRGVRAVGIDYSPRMVELAKTFSEQPVVLGDFASLPFEDNSFDAAWAVASLLHLPRSSVPYVLSEIHRVLKNGSYLLTSVKEGHGEATDILGRCNVFFSLEEWAEVHLANGYEVAHIERTVEARESEQGRIDKVTWIECLARTRRRDTEPSSW